MIDLQTLLTAQQVADMLCITVATLAIWRSSKRYPLAYVKIGRAVRYNLKDVIAFIESRTHISKD